MSRNWRGAARAKDRWTCRTGESIASANFPVFSSASFALTHVFYFLISVAMHWEYPLLWQKSGDPSMW